jgi:hypothetical protein
MSGKKAPAKKKVGKKKAGHDGADVVKDESGGKTRNPNFHQDEDELLSRAWVSASVDPSKGNQQKSCDFWKEVQKRYELLQVRSDSMEVATPRDWMQLKYRFLRHIACYTMKFNKHFRAASKAVPSGELETDAAIMETAMEDYLQEEGFRFKFAVCVPILHAVPKFDPFFTPVAETATTDGEPSTATNNSGSAMGANMERPIGVKAAKAQKKEAVGVAAEHSKQMMAKFTVLVDSAVRTEAFEQLISLGKWYQSIGDMDRARGITQQLEELRMKDSMARAALLLVDGPLSSSEPSGTTTPHVSSGEEDGRIGVAPLGSSILVTSTAPLQSKKRRKRRKKKDNEEAAQSQNLLADTTDEEEEDEGDDSGEETDDTDDLIRTLRRKRREDAASRPRDLVAQLFETPPPCHNYYSAPNLLQPPARASTTSL